MPIAFPPDDTLLRRFLLGDLPPDELDAVARYVEEHPEVGSTLASLKADDTLLSALRQPADADPPGVAAAAARAAGLMADGATGTFGSADPAATTASQAGPPADDLLAALAPAEAAGELGRLGGYRVLRLLGRGGMGAVFEAADDRLGRRVALKVMLPAVAARAEARLRFLREARAAAAVEHDHIVPIYQTGEDRGVPFLAMPLLAGETLEDRLRDGRPLAVGEVLRVGREVADGLAAAHAAGLIHRDVKPSNVWLERTAGGSYKRARILDFGLARTAAGEDGLTEAGAILGTPAYMAPEQARGQTLDGRADLFSLGCVLYHAATGRRPFTGADTFSVLTALATTDPPPAAAVNPVVPAGLSDLIARLLAKDPAGRPASADEAAAELARLAAEPAPDAHTHVLPGGRRDGGGEATEAIPAPPRKRRRWRVAAAVLFLAAGAAAAANGPTVVRVVTNQGELVVEVDDPDIEVTVKQGGVVVADRVKDRRFVLTAGKGEVEFTEAGGARGATRAFEITRGDRVAVRATAAEVAAARPAPVPAPAPVPPPSSQPAPPAGFDAAAERRAAELLLPHVFSLHLRVRKGEERDVRPGDPLPDGPFAVEGVNFHQRSDLPADFTARVFLAAAAGMSALERVAPYLAPVSAAELEALSRLPCAARVRALALYQYRPTAAGVDALRRFPRLEHLEFDGAAADDALLARLGELPALRRLNVTNLGASGRVSPAGMDAFAALRLRTFSLQYCRGLGPDHFRGVARMPGLTDLGLWRSGLGDDVTAVAAGCPRLESFYLDAERATDAGLDALRACTPLRTLRLDNAPAVTDAGVRRLAAALPWCTIHRNGTATVPDAAAPAVAAERAAADRLRKYFGLGLANPEGSVINYPHPGLPVPANPFWVWGVDTRAAPGDGPAAKAALFKELPGMHGNFAFQLDDKENRLRWTADDVAALAALPPRFAVGKLDLTATPLTPALADALARLPDLHTVAVRAADADDALLERLADRLPPRLTELRLVGLGAGGKVTPRGLAALARLRVPTLDLRGCGGITPDGWAAVARMPELEKLILYDAALGDGALPALAGSRTLKEVLLGGTAVTDAGLPALYGMATLRHVHLGGTRVTRAGAERLAAALPLCRVEWNGTVAEPAAPDPDRAAAAYVFARGGVVKVKGTWDESRAAADLPAGPVRLTEVLLWHRPGVTDDGLALFGGCKDLRTAQLGGAGAGVTDAGMAHLAKLPGLAVLDVGLTGVTDAGLAHFRGHPGFESLVLFKCKVTGAGLAHLGGGKRLGHLNLYGVPVGDDALRHFAPAPEMWWLDLDGTKVTDAGVALFAGSKKLGRLHLAKTAVTDAALAHARAWPALDRLVLDDTGVTDAGLAHLAGAPALRELHLERTKVTDAGLAHLRTCPKLALLFLDGTGVTDAGLDTLAGHPGLRGLYLRGSKATAAGVTRFAAARPECRVEWDGGVVEPKSADPDRAAAAYVFARGGHVKVAGKWERLTGPGELPAGGFQVVEVGLWHRPGVTDEGLAVVAGCRKLAWVSLDGTGVTDAGLAHLAKLPDLAYLDVHGTRVTDAGLAAFRGRPGFTGLNLGRTKVTAAGLAHLGDSRRLTVLNLLNLPVGDDDVRRFAPAPEMWDLTLAGTKLTDAGLAAFAGCKKLGRLDVSRTKVTDAGLAHVPGWPALATLLLNGTGVTDAGLARVAGCKTLTHLGLEGTAVTDAGVDRVVTCPKLEAVYLAGTGVTDAGLAKLAGLTGLRALNVRGTKATAEGVRRLAAARPECRVEWDGGTIEPRKGPQ